MTVDKIIHKTTFKNALVEKRVLFYCVERGYLWQNLKQYIVQNATQRYFA